jgi:hypothetical protein
VVQRGGHPGFLDEALPELLAVGEVGREQLQRDLAAEAHVLGAVHDRHAAAADQGIDPVVGDHAARFEGCHRSGCSGHVNLWVSGGSVTSRVTSGARPGQSPEV